MNFRLLVKTKGLALLNPPVFPYKRDNVYCSDRILAFFKGFGIFQGFPHCKNAAKFGGFGGEGSGCGKCLFAFQIKVVLNMTTPKNFPSSMNLKLTQTFTAFFLKRS